LFHCQKNFLPEWGKVFSVMGKQNGALKRILFRAC